VIRVSLEGEIVNVVAADGTPPFHETKKGEILMLDTDNVAVSPLHKVILELILYVIAVHDIAKQVTGTEIGLLPHNPFPRARTEIYTASPGLSPDTRCVRPMLPLLGVINEPPFTLTWYPVAPVTLFQTN
jgi:hypothetical protein